MLNDGDKTILEAGLEFLKPYYLSTLLHTEFVHTQTSEDRKRATRMMRLITRRFGGLPKAEMRG